MPYASEVLVMCFFMRLGHRLIAPHAMYALDLFRERIRPYKLDWYYDYEGQGVELTETLWNTIREQVLGPDEIMLPRFAGGRGAITDLYVEYRGLRIPSPWPHRQDDASFLFFRMPVQFLEESGPAQVRALALDVAEELPFNSGYVTLALYHADHVPDTVDIVRKRYPGMHLMDTAPELDMGTRVDGVHWLNFLGQPVLGQLGGVTGLRERLTHPGISLHEMRGDRVLISLGEEPSVGDTKAGETLPMHRELARLLEPHIYHYNMPFGRMSPEEQLHWERRFLGRS
jgi:hypothetical protein